MVAKLKQTLLDLNFVVDNSFLDDYCELVVSNLTNDYMPFETNKHHIVPKHYFLNTGKVVDNSSSNIVVLTCVDHVLAHWLLANCASNTYYFYANMSAVLFVASKYNLLPEEFFKSEEALNSYKQYYAEHCKLKSEKYKGEGNPNYGSGTNHGGCFRGHHSEYTRTLISLALKGRESNRKGCEVREEQRLKLSTALKLYLTDPENLLKHSEAAKRGWETRKENGTTCTTNGLHHYTDGVNLIYAVECPEGYYPGHPDYLIELRREITNNYLKIETPEKKQQRIIKAKETVKNWTDEYREDVKRRIRIGTAAAKSAMSEEQLELARMRASEGLKRYHANMTPEKKACLNRKNSEGQQGKKRYKDPVTNKRKMFKPGEQPDNWVLIEYDWYINTITGKRTRLERDVKHEDIYVKISNNNG